MSRTSGTSGEVNGPSAATSPGPPGEGPVHVKPKYRGVSHQVWFFVSLVLDGILIAQAHSTRGYVADAIYSFTLTGMFGVSGAFHRHTWSPAARRRMRRADHSMIFLLVAGTYTPISLLGLHGRAQDIILWTVWIGAAGGVVLKFAWIDAPKWLAALVYVVLGWTAVGIMPELVHFSGYVVVTLVMAGGIIYSLGAVVYARKRPDPSPTVFGYHEVFHALVITAAMLQWTAVLLLTLR